MSATPRHPHELLFAKLSQAMSAPGAIVRHDLGPKAAAQAGQGDRFEWIPGRLQVVQRPFQFPGRVTAADQAVPYEVRIYGSSYARLLELHRLLAASLELLIGPEGGSAPSDDAAPAVLTGTVDLATLLYPYSGLIGKTLDVNADGLVRAVTFPGTALASSQAIVDALNAASNATSRNGINAHFRIRRVDIDEEYLGIYAATSLIEPFTSGATLTLDPTTGTSACAILGFTSGAGNLSATGTGPTKRYQPGYKIGDSDKPEGGHLGSTSWSTTVPVTLYAPIEVVRDLVGTIQTVPIAVSASGGATPDETITNP